MSKLGINADLMKDQPVPKPKFDKPKFDNPNQTIHQTANNLSGSKKKIIVKRSDRAKLDESVVVNGEERLKNWNRISININEEEWQFFKALREIEGINHNQAIRQSLKRYRLVMESDWKTRGLI